MCLLKVVIDAPGVTRPPIADVMDLRVDGPLIRITTLFGEVFALEDLAIAHIDLGTNVVHLVGDPGHECA